MKSSVNRRFVIAVLTIACLTAVLLAVAPIRSSTLAPPYDTWLDINNDDKIDIRDVSAVARAFGAQGALGQNVSKASLEYDSGWVDITGMAGQNITITHGLNVTDWNDEDIDVSIIGKTSQGGELQRYLGLTDRFHGWSKTYGAENGAEAYALVQTSDGGYALAGTKGSWGTGYGDFWLVKTDVFGNVQWNQTYGGAGRDEAYALVQTSDGGYALAGTTSPFGAEAFDFWLVKTDSSGNVQWNQTYGGAEWDIVYALVQTSDDGYALAGLTGTSLRSTWLVKTDADGNMQWSNYYGGVSDVAQALVQTSDGGYALAGYTKSFGAGSDDFWLVKTDVFGNVQWNQTYGRIFEQWTYDEGAQALVQTGDGGYALAGYSRFVPVYSSIDFWLVKTDVEGDTSKIGDEFSLAWIDSSANTITLYRGETDPYWNFVRVRLWKPR